LNWVLGEFAAPEGLRSVEVDLDHLESLESWRLEQGKNLTAFLFSFANVLIMVKDVEVQKLETSIKTLNEE
jgi:hypothetical protein